MRGACKKPHDRALRNIVDDFAAELYTVFPHDGHLLPPLPPPPFPDSLARAKQSSEAPERRTLLGTIEHRAGNPANRESEGREPRLIFQGDRPVDHAGSDYSTRNDSTRGTRRPVPR
jgi:hypothetical protein